EASENLKSAIDHRRLDAETAEDTGEFDRDIAAAGDHDGLRQLLQLEGLIRGDAQFVARQSDMRIGASAGRDENLRGAEPAPVAQQDFMGAGQGGPALEDLGSCTL